MNHNISLVLTVHQNPPRGCLWHASFSAFKETMPANLTIVRHTLLSSLSPGNCLQIVHTQKLTLHPDGGVKAPAMYTISCTHIPCTCIASVSAQTASYS